MRSDQAVHPLHALCLYRGTETLRDGVTAFLAEGLIRRTPAVVIANPEHSDAIAAGLRGLSFSMDALHASGALLMFDADDTLRSISLNGWPDAVRIRSFVQAAIGRLPNAASGLRIYSEMACRLEQGAEFAAALRLEELWDALTVTHGCTLLCGHAAGDVEATGTRRAVCACHSHILADNGLPHPAFVG
jgi:hypothetical protein